MEKKRMNLMEFVGENPSKSKVPKKRPATDKQVSYAKAIADTLGLGYPDFEDFNDTSVFISYNKDDYYEALDDVEAHNSDYGSDGSNPFQRRNQC